MFVEKDSVLFLHTTSRSLIDNNSHKRKMIRFKTFLFSFVLLLPEKLHLKFVKAAVHEKLSLQMIIQRSS